jgi:serine/threonine-protein kinase
LGVTPAHAQAPAALVHRHTDSIEAYNLYLQGKHYWTKRVVGLMWKGVECYRKAIEADPGYALAYVGLVEAYYVMAIYGIVSNREASENSRACASKAIELDPHLAESHYVQGLVKHFFERDLHGAAAAYGKAMQVDPGLAVAHAWQGYLNVLFAPEKVIEEAEIGLLLEPFSPLFHGVVGFAAYLLRDNERALQYCSKGIELDPSHAFPRWVRGLAFLRTSNKEAGVQDLEKALAAMGRRPYFLGLTGYAYGKSDRISDAREILAELEGARAVQFVSPLYFCWVYLGLGEKEAAIANFELAVKEGDLILTAFMDPIYDLIRDDPRFACIATMYAPGSRPLVLKMLLQEN